MQKSLAARFAKKTGQPDLVDLLTDGCQRTLLFKAAKQSTADQT